MSQLLLIGKALRRDTLIIDALAPMYPSHAMICTYNLEEETSSEKPPAVQINFTGFNNLCADAEAMKTFDALGPHPDFGLVAFGTVTFSEDVVADIRKANWDDADGKWVQGFMAAVMTADFGVDIPSHFQMKLTAESPRIAYFMMTVIVEETVWHQIYASKSLELTAAYRYYQSLGRTMAVEPAVPDDLSHNRTLN